MNSKSAVSSLRRTRLLMILLPLVLCVVALSFSYAMYHRFTEDTVECVESLLLNQGTELSVDVVAHKLTTRLERWTHVWLLELGIFVLVSYFTSYMIAQYSRGLEERIQHERVERERLFSTYKQVVQAITNSSLQLLSPEEYEAEYGSAEPLLVLKLQNKSDIAHSRDEIDRFLVEKLEEWDDPFRSRVLLCLAEAMSNVIKHTPGGRVLVFIDSTGPRFHVEAFGSGLDLNKLPYMLFVKGFSTSDTLGAGFPIMMRYLKQITISTSPNGTALVLRP